MSNIKSGNRIKFSCFRNIIKSIIVFWCLTLALSVYAQSITDLPLNTPISDTISPLNKEKIYRILIGGGEHLFVFVEKSNAWALRLDIMYSSPPKDTDYDKTDGGVNDLTDQSVEIQSTQMGVYFVRLKAIGDTQGGEYKIIAQTLKTWPSLQIGQQVAENLSYVGAEHLFWIKPKSNGCLITLRGTNQNELPILYIKKDSLPDVSDFDIRREGSLEVTAILTPLNESEYYIKIANSSENGIDYTLHVTDIQETVRSTPTRTPTSTPTPTNTPTNTLTPTFTVTPTISPTITISPSPTSCGVLLSSPGKIGVTPEVATDPFGNAHIIWKEEDGKLMYARIGPDNTIDIPAKEIYQAASYSFPRIAIDTRGNAHIILRLGTGPFSSFVYKKITDGEVVESNGITVLYGLGWDVNVGWPSISVNPKTNLPSIAFDYHVYIPPGPIEIGYPWDSIKIFLPPGYGSSNPLPWAFFWDGIWVMSLDESGEWISGSSWIPYVVKKPLTPFTGFLKNPEVIFDQSGQAHCVWMHQEVGWSGPGIAYAKQGEDKWHELTNEDTRDVLFLFGGPEIAVSEDGSLDIVWTRDNGPLVWKRMNASGLITQYDPMFSIKGSAARYPNVSVSDSQNAVAAWTDHNQGQIYIKPLLGDETADMITCQTGTAMSFDISLFEDNYIDCVWQEKRKDISQVYHRRIKTNTCTAIFGYEPPKPCIDTPITFDGSKSHSEEGEIVQYEWDFGDGITSSYTTVSHAYSIPGNYKVKLTVMDSNGQKDTSSLPIYVTADFNMIWGYVTDKVTKAAIASATVQLGDWIETTDSNGKYVFKHCGFFFQDTLTVEKAGYDSKSCFLSDTQRRSLNIIRNFSLSVSGNVSVKCRYFPTGDKMLYFLNEASSSQLDLIFGASYPVDFEVKVNWGNIEDGIVEFRSPINSFLVRMNDVETDKNGYFKQRINVSKFFGHLGSLTVTAYDGSTDGTLIGRWNGEDTFRVIDPPSVLKNLPISWIAHQTAWGNDDDIEYRGGPNFLSFETNADLSFLSKINIWKKGQSTKFIRDLGWDPKLVIKSSGKATGGLGIEVSKDAPKDEPEPNVFGIPALLEKINKNTFSVIDIEKRLGKSKSNVDFVLGYYLESKFDKKTLQWEKPNNKLGIGVKFKIKSPDVLVFNLYGLMPIYVNGKFKTKLIFEFYLDSLIPPIPDSVEIPFEIGVEVAIGIALLHPKLLAGEAYGGGEYKTTIFFDPTLNTKDDELAIYFGIRLVTLLGNIDKELFRWDFLEQKIGSNGLNDFISIPISYGNIEKNQWVFLPRESPKRKQKNNSNRKLVKERKDYFSILRNEDVLEDEDIFRFNPPSMATKNMATLLLWIRDNVNRNEYNRTELVFSRSVGSDHWTPTTPVDSNGAADFNPDVEVVGEHFVAAWQRFGTIFDSTPEFNQMLESVEIYASAYNPLTHEWENATRLSNNNYFDRPPQISGSQNGTALLSWIANPGNDLIGSATSPNEIISTWWDGSSWDSPIVVAHSIGSILSSALAYDGNEAVFIYASDIDGNLRTETDMELFGSSLNRVGRFGEGFPPSSRRYIAYVPIPTR